MLIINSVVFNPRITLAPRENIPPIISLGFLLAFLQRFLAGTFSNIIISWYLSLACLRILRRVLQGFLRRIPQWFLHVFYQSSFRESSRYTSPRIQFKVIVPVKQFQQYNIHIVATFSKATIALLRAFIIISTKCPTLIRWKVIPVIEFYR